LIVVFVRCSLNYTEEKVKVDFAFLHARHEHLLLTVVIHCLQG